MSDLTLSEYEIIRRELDYNYLHQKVYQGINGVGATKKMNSPLNYSPDNDYPQAIEPANAFCNCFGAGEDACRVQLRARHTVMHRQLEKPKPPLQEYCNTKDWDNHKVMEVNRQQLPLDGQRFFLSTTLLNVQNLDDARDHLLDELGQYQAYRGKEDTRNHWTRLVVCKIVAVHPVARYYPYKPTYDVVIQMLFVTETCRLFDTVRSVQNFIGQCQVEHTPFQLVLLDKNRAKSKVDFFTVPKGEGIGWFESPLPSSPAVANKIVNEVMPFRGHQHNNMPYTVALLIAQYNGERALTPRHVPYDREYARHMFPTVYDDFVDCPWIKPDQDLHALNNYFNKKVHYLATNARNKKRQKKEKQD